MLDRYINLLKSSQVVAFPTETVYGLGAVASDGGAVRKIFEIKQRPPDNPLIVHIASHKMLHEITNKIPDKAEKLMSAFWPGALTLIFEKKPRVLDIITAGLPTVAVRWPSHPLSQDLIARVGPLVAPSANSSGKPSPTKPEHIKEDLGESFPVIEAGETQIGLESTVLDVTQKPFQLYRPGAISRKQIEKVIDEQIITVQAKEVEQPKSPGMKYSHYAPDAAVRWLRAGEAPEDEQTLYLIHYEVPEFEADNIVNFAENYDEMAHQLFDRFRSADHKGYKIIAIEPFPEDVLKREPLAEALQNRISKAIGI
ncbi:MAG TPA: L-threonylcarbamoyladenylate synthase [Balneolaceae bacterium]|nr:L-threonylcarbamoyladenylate synthase [Balneolaceae bacterium]